MVVPDLIPLRKSNSVDTKLVITQLISPAIRILIIMALKMGVFLPSLNLFKRSQAFVGFVTSS